MKLSVIIPVFDEAGTLDEVLRRVRATEYDKQIVLVDDCSTDGSREILRGYEQDDDVLVLYHATNRGKGACLRTALEHVDGDIVLIQDVMNRRLPAWPLIGKTVAAILVFATPFE